MIALEAQWHSQLGTASPVCLLDVKLKYSLADEVGHRHHQARADGAVDYGLALLLLCWCMCVDPYYMHARIYR